MLKHDLILFDTETTALTGPSVQPLDQQPRILEFAAMRVIDDQYLTEVDRVTFLADPGLPITAEITKITGLTEADLKAAGTRPFARQLDEVAALFLGAGTLVAHNLPFDRDVLAYELARVERTCRFPWPPRHLCTAQESADLMPNGKVPKLTELYELLYGRKPVQTHRAMGDVELLADCARALRARGRL